MAEQISVVANQPMVKENKLNVAGVAIRQGISRNGIKYTKEELSKFAETLTNRPILKDHQATVDNAVGLVSKSHTLNQGETVDYKGWVKEDGSGLLEKIKDGRIKEVSIGATAGRLVRENDESDVMLAQDLRGLELSLTPVPGVIGTSISQTLENLKQGKKVSIMENVNSFVDEGLSGVTVQPADSSSDSNSEPNTKVQKKGRSKQQLPDQGADVEPRTHSTSTPFKLPGKTEQGADIKCPKCGEEFSSKADLSDHMNEEHGQQSYKGQMLHESLNIAETEVVKELQAEVAILIKEKRDRVVTEYRRLASERGIKQRDLTNLSTDIVEVLIDELKSMKVDLTQGRVVLMKNDVVPNVLETTKYGGQSLLFEDGVIIERPLEGGQGFAITCDPSKMKAEGVRWRAFKNPSPSYI